MITLESFYDLISRNAQVTLLNTRCRTNIFTGSARDIPDEYSDCPVEDFSMNDSGHLTFKIKVKETRPAGSNWQEGTIRVHDRIYHYWVKQYPESSKYGIGGGRVEADAEAQRRNRLQLRSRLGRKAHRRRHRAGEGHHPPPVHAVRRD